MNGLPVVSWPEDPEATRVTVPVLDAPVHEVVAEG